MTKDELEKQYPELCAELRAEGARQERERVVKHLEFGEKGLIGPNKWRRAFEAIRAGTPLTTEIIELYYEDRLRGQRQQDWQDDCDAAAAVVDGAMRMPTTDVDRSMLADAIERLQGGE